MILPAWFDHQQESFLIKKFRSKSFADMWKAVTLLLKMQMKPLMMPHNKWSCEHSCLLYFNNTLYCHEQETKWCFATSTIPIVGTIQIVAGTVASWLVCSTLERVVWVRALAGHIMLCSQARHFILIVLLSAEVYEWALVNIRGVMSHTLLLVSNHCTRMKHAVTENNKINTGMNIK